MDVAFEVVHRDQGLVEGEGQGLGVCNAYQQCSGEAWAFGYGYGVEILEGDAGFGDGGADDGDDVAQVLAGG